MFLIFLLLILHIKRAKNISKEGGNNMEMKVVYPTKEGVLVKSLYIEGQE